MILTTELTGPVSVYASPQKVVPKSIPITNLRPLNRRLLIMSIMPPERLDIIAEINGCVPGTLIEVSELDEDTLEVARRCTSLVRKREMARSYSRGHMLTNPKFRACAYYFIRQLTTLLRLRMY